MSPSSAPLPNAVAAFDALAPRFDERFGSWLSVAAQRRAVRRYLLRAFPEGAHLLELGGGTGEDALFLAERGRRVHLTDGSPEMVSRARAKAEKAGLLASVSTEAVTLEGLGAFAARRASCPPFDGAFSNFASLNCVQDLRAVGAGLARLLPGGAHAVLVLFGPFSVGEMLVEALRGRFRNVFRRLSSQPAAARVGEHRFNVSYPAPRRVARALQPWFRLARVQGIGLFVPPSAAEPEISRFPALLALLSALDRAAARPLALLADHVLLDFVRTASPPQGPE